MYQVVGSEGKARVDEMYEAESEERKREIAERYNRHNGTRTGGEERRDGDI
jgi:hypothetical protein